MNTSRIHAVRCSGAQKGGEAKGRPSFEEGNWFFHKISDYQDDLTLHRDWTGILKQQAVVILLSGMKSLFSSANKKARKTEFEAGVTNVRRILILLMKLTEWVGHSMHPSHLHRSHSHLILTSKQILPRSTSTDLGMPLKTCNSFLAIGSSLVDHSSPGCLSQRVCKWFPPELPN